MFPAELPDGAMENGKLEMMWAWSLRGCLCGSTLDGATLRLGPVYAVAGGNIRVSIKQWQDLGCFQARTGLVDVDELRHPMAPFFCGTNVRSTVHAYTLKEAEASFGGRHAQRRSQD